MYVNVCFYFSSVKPTAEDSVEKVPLITAKTLHHLDNDANFCYADESYHDDDDGKAPGHHKHSRHHRHGNRRRHGSKHQKYHHKQKTQPQIVENQTSTSGTRDTFVEDVIRPRSASPLYRESPAAPELPPPPSEPPQGFPRRSTFPEITLTADNPMARPRSQTEPSMLIIQADQNEGSYESVGHNNSNNCNNSNDPGTECTGLGGPTHDGLIDSWTSGRHQGGTSVTSHQGQ
ncbi:hypothetical protein LSAT2_024527 [Lamellibrachia satsuma]|nr:hypothetical protein LSAT2_024527 [Lamellibrachia satsuma]